MPEPIAVDRLYQECCERLRRLQPEEGRAAGPSRGFGVPQEVFTHPLLTLLVSAAITGVVSSCFAVLTAPLWRRVFGHVAPEEVLQNVTAAVEAGVQQMRERGTVELRSEIQTAMAQMQTFVQQALKEVKEPPSAEQVTNGQEKAQTLLEEVGFPEKLAEKGAEEVTVAVVDGLGKPKAP
jgi:hypothetical protein